jgi:teichuronic acid biosynthesis glycosyltransferase TuaC
MGAGMDDVGPGNFVIGREHQEEQMKVLMVGPIEVSGGVSIHGLEIVKQMERLGAEVIVYNISPNKQHFELLDGFIKLYKRTVGLFFKLLKRHKEFDIVHVQTSGRLGGFIPAITCAFWKNLLRFNLIVTFHYRSDKDFLSKNYRFFHFVLSRSDHFFVVSRAQAENFYQLFRQQFHDSISIVSNGFSPELFYPRDKNKVRRELNLPLDKAIVMTVGNLVPIKGHEYLIEAMVEIVKHRRDVLCIIVGGGKRASFLNRQIQDSELHDYVKLIGRKPHNEIPIWMSACDLFVLPSLSEGLPVVHLEAMACGKPVVATYNGGSGEIITSEEYGLLCQPADSKELAEKILISLDRKWDNEKIIEYAQHFTWHTNAEKTLRIYEAVLRGTQQTPIRMQAE